VSVVRVALQGADGRWPGAAVHDTVAAIIRQPEYQRSVRATLFERILDWIGDAIRRLFAAVPNVPNAKWIILGIAIALVLAIAVRFLLGNEAEERRRRARPGAVFGSGDPWIEAERLAAAGDYTDAAHLLYRGVTERLAAAESIRLHPSKTSGDYARELRLRGSPVHAEFRQFGRRYDRAMFGAGTCDAATYATLRELALKATRREDRAA
jgi:hypothetical protein